MKINSAIVILFICELCNGQTFNNCDIYQFAGTDSSKKFICLKQTFNLYGQILLETYQGYQKNSSEGSSDGTYFYFYLDTLLVKRLFASPDKDSAKMICYYNNKNQLIREEHFNFEKRMKKSVDKGYGRPGGCVVTDADYEKNRTWEKTSEINYSYDDFGNVILYDAPKIHFSSQNKYTWTYDSLGRILKYSSFDNDRLIWIEDYSYFKDSYRFTRIWYDYNGNPKLDDLPIFTFTYKLNDKSKVFEERITTEKGELRSREVFLYDPMGKIIKSTAFDSLGKAEITHVYVYN